MAARLAPRAARSWLVRSGDISNILCSRLTCRQASSKPANALPFARAYSSSAEPDLKETLKKVIPEKRELLKQVKSKGDTVIGEVKIENALGGMR